MIGLYEFAQKVAAGNLQPEAPLTQEPIDIAQGISHATYIPVTDMARDARHLLSGDDFTIAGKAGESNYVMVDFGEPVHGFPQFSLASSTAGVAIDLGYGEAFYSYYSGKVFVRPDGWIDPERVVGHGYADHYKTGTGIQNVEIPNVLRNAGIHPKTPDGRVCAPAASMQDIPFRRGAKT